MVKKISMLIFLILCMLLTGVTVYGADTQQQPELESIKFKNAEIDGSFSPDIMEYGLKLQNTAAPATLESYKISGDADLFVTYDYDNTNHQTGLTVTLEYEWGSTIYNFRYLNAAEYDRNSDNLLSQIYCTYGELSPKLNDEDTSYNLYIPSDLTELTITPVTDDIHAYCAPIELTLSESQTPDITLCCTASDGSEREYLLEIKRVDKTTAQVAEEMAQPGFTSFVDGTRFYQKPEFLITAGTIAGGIIIIAALFVITKKIAVNPYDKEEKPFFSEDE